MCTAGPVANKYEKEPVDDTDFPSIQEAAMMARGCKVEEKRKPPKIGE